MFKKLIQLITSFSFTVFFISLYGPLNFFLAIGLHIDYRITFFSSYKKIDFRTGERGKLLDYMILDSKYKLPIYRIFICIKMILQVKLQRNIQTKNQISGSILHR
jgi:hypothetical protein